MDCCRVQTWLGVVFRPRHLLRAAAQHVHTATLVLACWTHGPVRSSVTGGSGPHRSKEGNRCRVERCQRRARTPRLEAPMRANPDVDPITWRLSHGGQPLNGNLALAARSRGSARSATVLCDSYGIQGKAPTFQRLQACIGRCRPGGDLTLPICTPRAAQAAWGRAQAPRLRSLWVYGAWLPPWPSDPRPAGGDERWVCRARPHHCRAACPRSWPPRGRGAWARWLARACTAALRDGRGSPARTPTAGCRPCRRNVGRLEQRRCRGSRI